MCGGIKSKKSVAIPLYHNLDILRKTSEGKPRGAVSTMSRVEVISGSIVLAVHTAYISTNCLLILVLYPGGRGLETPTFDFRNMRGGKRRQDTHRIAKSTATINMDPQPSGIRKVAPCFAHFFST